MRTLYRKFPVDVRVAIVKRATAPDGRIQCEGCGAWLKSAKDWEIDHVICEAIRPDADKQRRLTPADGRLLCKARCHRGPEGKTGQDVAAVAEAKRREAASLGIERLGKRKMRTVKREPKAPLTKIASGPTWIQRRFGL